MPWTRELARRLRMLFRRRRFDRDLQDEMRLHLELREQDHLARGLSPDAARRAARLAFGNPAALRETSREAWGWRWLEQLAQDLRYGVRSMLRARLFTGAALLALALGIGANTALFSVVNGVLLRSLPYNDAERLTVTPVSLPDYADLQASVPAFDATAVWASNLYNLKLNGESEQVLGGVVTPAFFQILGDAQLGRTFREDESDQMLAVLSYSLWQRKFGADPAVLGRPLTLGTLSYTIVGVMPPEFQMPSAQFEVWVPAGAALAAARSQLQNRSLRIFRALGRLRPGATLDQARAQLAALSARLQTQYPESNRDVTLQARPLYEVLVGSVRPALLILLGVVGLVLLIACANVANLMLARTTARSREMAVRAALGATRFRLIRQLLTESVLLALGGGLGGVLLAVWAVRLLRAANPVAVPRLAAVRIDVNVLLFAFGVSLLTGIVFGVAPALQSAAANSSPRLTSGTRSTPGTRTSRRLRSAFVAAEVAICLVVLVAAGLLIKSFARLLHTDPGFVPDRLVTMMIEMSHLKEPQQRAATATRMLEAIRTIPGVEAAGGATGLPPVTPQRGTGFEIEGIQVTSPNLRSAYFIAASPDYFRALGTRMLAGRPFGAADVDGAPEVVIVNRTLARNLFGGQDPIGRRLRLLNPDQKPVWRTIVGVADDVKYSGLDDPGANTVYTPFPQTPFLWMYYVIRTSPNPGPLAAEIRRVAASVDGTLTPAAIRPMRDVMSRTVAQPRFTVVLLACFAALALVLAAVGIYGVVSYSVTQRTHEIGVRMALGASQADVLRMIVGQGLRVIVLGLAIGLAGALFATRLLARLLFEVRPTDPATFVAIAAGMVAVSLAASYLPARRATRIDPMVALRYE